VCVGGGPMDRVGEKDRLDIPRGVLERILRLLKLHPCKAHNLKGRSERSAWNNDLVTSEGNVSMRS
jgi:hypothetical protein